MTDFKMGDKVIFKAKTSPSRRGVIVDIDENLVSIRLCNRTFKNVWASRLELTLDTIRIREDKLNILGI